MSCPADSSAVSRQWDRFCFDSPRVRALALPAAAVTAIVVNATPFGVLLTPFHIWIHEFGHAVPAWLAGYRALPLPFGWTSIDPERSVVVYGAVLFLLGVLFWAAWRERLRGALALAVVLALVQFVVTWRTPAYTVEKWIYFSGVGGEFYLSAFLIAAFYFRMPDRWRWDFWRYVVLFVAASSFFRSYHFWRQIRAGQAQIPWGSILGRGDAGGDMNTLSMQYGWGDARIIETYNRLGDVCVLALVAVYLVFLIRPDVFQRSRLPRASPATACAETIPSSNDMAIPTNTRRP